MNREIRIAVYKHMSEIERGADIAVKNLVVGLSERGCAAVLIDKPSFDGMTDADFGCLDVLVSAGTHELLDVSRAMASRPLKRFPPVVQQFHTDPAYSFRHWIRRWRRNRDIKAALRNVAAIQVLRSANADFVKRIAPQVPVHVIGNWSKYDFAASPSGPSTIVACPGALNKDKNQELLIRAFARVAEQFADWTVELYGVGSPANEKFLRKVVSRQGMEHRIAFKGYQDLVAVYERCAFVAFPSKTEVFPLVLVEAAAFGKPVVMTTDWIGTAAAEGGGLTRPTVDAYAQGLRRLMADASARERMGRAARGYCEKCFAREEILGQWESLLRGVAGGRHGKGA